MFAVSMFVGNVQEVQSALTGMRCLLKVNCLNKTLKIVTTGMSETSFLHKDMCLMHMPVSVIMIQVVYEF